MQRVALLIETSRSYGRDLLRGELKWTHIIVDMYQQRLLQIAKGAWGEVPGDRHGNNSDTN